MLEHPNSASGTGSEPNSPGIHARSSRRRQAVAVIGGALVCTAVAAFMVSRSSWWTGPATRPGAGPPPREEPRAGATMPGPSTSTARPEVAAPTAESIRQEAFAVIRQLMEEFPDDPGAMCLMANVHMRFTQSAEATKWWQRAIDRNPRQANAYHGLALVANETGDRKKALELWRKAQEINPDLPGVYGAPAEALLEMGRPQEAAAALEKEIRLSSGTPRLYYLLGQAYHQQQEYGKAVERYQKAIEMEPRDPKPYYGLASALAELGAPDRARECMEKFRQRKDQEEQAMLEVRRTADDPFVATQVLAEAHTDAAGFYAACQRLKEAEAHWQRAASVDARHTRCRRALAEWHRLGGRPAEALKFAEELRKIDPAQASYHLYAGDLLIQLERYDAAEEALRRVLDLAPNRPGAYRPLIQLLLPRNKNLPEARALAQKLVELEPTATNWRLLAEACCRGGDLDGARQAVRRALDFETPGAKTPEGRTPPEQQK